MDEPVLLEALGARAAARRVRNTGAECAMRTEPSLCYLVMILFLASLFPWGRHRSEGRELTSRTFLMPEPQVVTGQGLGPFRSDCNKQALKQPQKMNDLMNHWVMRGGVYMNSNLWSKAGLIFLLLQYCVWPPSSLP